MPRIPASLNRRAGPQLMLGRMDDASTGDSKSSSPTLRQLTYSPEKTVSGTERGREAQVACYTVTRDRAT